MCRVREDEHRDFETLKHRTDSVTTQWRSAFLMSILAEDAFFLREDASNLLPEDEGSGIVPFVPGG